MLKGKTAVITGASRGIGKAIALKMAENNADIAVVYRSGAAEAEEVVELARLSGVKAKAYACDVSDFEESKRVMESIISEFGKIDILVNNAGIIKDGLMLSMKEDDFDKVINVNLKGTFNTIKHCYTHFMKRRSGRIINISSISGLMGNAGQANYSASKAGIVGLTKTVAKELAGRNVTCNAIAPGFVETDMTDGLSEKMKEAVLSTVPLKRMGEPDDIAHAAVFLAGEGAKYITGEVLKVDGGLYI